MTYLKREIDKSCDVFKTRVNVLKMKIENEQKQRHNKICN